MRRIVLLNIVFGLLTAGLAPAATRLVPDEYPNIQSAIDDCNDGDVVIVAPGKYFEMINLKRKNITLRSTEPDNPNVVAATIIDGGAGRLVAVLNNSGVRFNPRVATFNSGEGPDCVLNGLTITNGRSGGVYCEDSSPTLLRCVFSHNRARGGGGMYNRNSTPTLIKCTFTENSASGGGGMYNHNSSPNLVKCTFTKNSARGGGGMSNSEGSKPMLTNCIFSRNSAEVSGGAISSGGFEDTAPTLKNCTLARNSAGVGGGGIYHGVAFGRLKVINCILWGNRDRGKIVAMAQIRNSSTAGAVINYSCIEGLDVPDVPEVLLCGPYGSGVGNIGKDPLFVDPNNGDYHLRSQAGRWDTKAQKWVRDDVTSPCVDAGDPNSLIADEPLPNNGAVNMGAYGGTSEASKSLARSTDITLPAGGEDLSVLETTEVVKRLAESKEKIELRKAAKVLGDRSITQKLDLTIEEKQVIENVVSGYLKQARSTNANERTEARQQIERLWHVAAPTLLKNLSNPTTAEMTIKSLILMRSEAIIKAIIEKAKTAQDEHTKAMAVFALKKMKEQRKSLIPGRECLDEEQSRILYDRLVAPALRNLEEEVNP